MEREDIEKFLKAGRIAGRARDFGASLIKEDSLVVDILDSIEEFIKKQGAGIAFPAQISINNFAAHSCSSLNDNTTIKAGDVVKLDVGAHIDGFIGDTALTVNLNKEFDDLVLASKKALNNASKLFVPGMKVGEIGAIIQETISQEGFSPVKNLSGHGLGRFEIHTSPSIPNIKIPESSILREGMTVACEPFATDGKGLIAESGEATVFSLGVLKPVRSPFARDVLKKIREFQGLPFASRWLEKELGLGKTRFGLKELERLGVIIPHPPLKEVANGLVSQHEHSFLVSDKPKISTLNED